MSYLSLNDIKVKITLKETEPMLARATVIFFDVIETHGWRVMTSAHEHPKFGEYLWIQAPSFKVFKNWKEIVYIPDKKSWELVTERIYDAFCMARTKNDGKQGVEEAGKQSSKEEEIDVKDIPF